jgi:hypothetical protein
MPPKNQPEDIKVYQFIHLGAYGAEPHATAKPWACVEGITEEGARVPKASRHIKYPKNPNTIYGISPAEVCREALALAAVARDVTKKKRLRNNGIVLLAGVASYPVLRVRLAEAGARDTYRIWREAVIKWLIEQFGEYLRCIVEHDDEEYLHIHFYVVPKLLPGFRLNWREVHPGRRMKLDAEEAGASTRDCDKAYRLGMSAWQDEYHYAVGRAFGHARVGPRRSRVNAIQLKMEKAMNAAAARQQAAFDARQDQLEREAAQRHADLDREHALRIAEADERARQDAEDNADLRAGCLVLKGRLVGERTARAATEAEVANLRARLAEYEPDIALQRVA